MEAQPMKMSKKGWSGGSARGSQPTRVGASPHMSVVRCQAIGTTASPSQGSQKRRANE
ncbi:hypothetical protein GBA52_008406 [Prunus armeniaca]|nr:hypothetical protein GBA52_008406 [Prunus armeniaca]